MNISTKFAAPHTSIFSRMSGLARQHGAVNLGQGFPDFDCDPELQNLMTEFLRKEKNQYAPMTGVPELRQAISDKVFGTCGVRYHSADEITVTAGATQALFCAITAFAGRGDEVILLDPSYDSYRPVIELNQAAAVAYELEAPDYTVNWEDFARLISPRTRMIIINNPHNPIGKTLKKQDLDALAKLTRGTDIVILSDEVYEHIVFDNAEHVSALSHPELKQRSLVCFSFGKTFHITGWKIGYCIAAGPLTEAFRQVHQWNVFSVHSVSQYAIAEYLQDKTHYEELAAFFERKRNLFQDAMKNSLFNAMVSEGSYFQLYDYSAISDKEDTVFAEELLVGHGVAGIPVSVFYASGRQDKVIRFCFAKKDESLLEAAARLCQVKKI